ncbi:CHAP domain-containing protein [Lacicoccus alkaliphilus]|uniref:Surface antigen n=1 Tax=Lacicoccus alkaliphilus DSM 16010 TaxID=1123231 RepID=A0A1M7FAD0_9BACL|nr:CHAP domain-containing protein [Salinicoccus alkaliphilus]SHM00679.1 Surface antigen [Salinicoccus alkaliphilus DSM 16010]
MKKTIVSIATVTALTGIASSNISANEYVPAEVQQNQDYTYNYETNGDSYSYYWYYGNTDGSQYANEYGSNTGQAQTQAPAAQSQQSTPAPAVSEAPAQDVQAPAVTQSQTSQDVQAPAVVETPAAASSSSFSGGTNFYPGGECTWYAFERRAELGKAVSGSWGNASNWAGQASAQGLTVNNSPSVGAIIQTPAYSNGAYGMGHVGVVESVNGDGSITISEMNWSGGLGGKTFRTLSAGQAANHNFIH